jgi:hypothetical protein
MAVALKKTGGLIESALDCDLLICDPGRSTISVLNRAAVKIWKMIDEGCDPDSMADRLIQAFRDVSHEQARSDVEEVLTVLKDAGLLSVDGHEIG